MAASLTTVHFLRDFKSKDILLKCDPDMVEGWLKIIESKVQVVGVKLKVGGIEI